MESEDIQSLASSPDPALPPPVADRKKILLQTLHLSVSTVLTQATRLIKNILLAGILGPASFGLWNGLQVFITYGMNVHLGVLQAIAREIPLKRGSGDLSSIPDVARAAFTVSLLASIGGGTLISLLAIWFVTAELDTMWPALLLLPVVVAQMIFIFGQFLLRSLDEFEALSRVLLFAAPLELGLTIGFAYAFGINGLIAGLALSQAAGALLALRVKRPFTLKLRLDRVIAGTLIRIGFPIMLTVLGYFVLTTIDRLLILSYAGSEALGYYSLGSLAITALGYIPIAVNQVMFPKFASRFGKTRDPQALAGYLRIPTLLTAHTMGFVLSVAVLSLPLVTIVLPEYTPGITSASLLLAGFYFVALTGSAANMMLTIGRNLEYLLFLAGAIGLAVGMDIFALSQGWGINGVATTTGFIHLIYSMTFVRYTMKRCLQPGSTPFGRFQEKLLVPWVLGFGLYLLTMQVTLGGVVAGTILRVALFSAVHLPISFWIVRRERLL